MGSIVRRHRHWSYSGWETSPPPSEIAERVARPEAGRNGTRDAMGKATDSEGTIWKYAFGEFYQTLEPEPTIRRPSYPRRGRPRS